MNLEERILQAETRILKPFSKHTNHYDTLFGGTSHVNDGVAFIAATRFTRKDV
jgi:acyl-CoA hydrolase